jgi:hypothetical protein
MKAIAQREIDDPITATERNCWFRAIRSQWMKARTDSTGKNDADRLL